MADENVPTVSRKRWIVLFVVVYLNISNAMLWLSFASVSNLAVHFFQPEVSEKKVDLFSLVFCITTVVAGLPEVWFIDKHGLRLAIVVGAVLNTLGAVLSTLIWIKPLYALAMAGQVVAGLAQPILYCVPTKLAEQWFPDNQRALATSLGIMASLVGQLIACGVTPFFVWKADKIKDMTLYYGIPSFAGTLIAVVSFAIVRSSKPDVPPSNSAAISTSYPYRSALKTVFRKKESIFLILGVGSVLGVSYTLMSRMEEILCTRGYGSDFSGWCTVSVMGCGLIGAALASIAADKTRGFILIIKICLTFMVISLCFFVVIVRYPHREALILTACGLVGFWGYAAFPVGLELAMEHSFTILPEATSSGLILIAGQILSIIYFAFFETLTSVYKYSRPGKDPETCTRTKTVGFSRTPDVVAEDSMCPLLVLAGVTTVLVGIFILFFKSDYNRMRTENRSMSAIVNDDDPIVNSTSFEDPSWHTSIYS